MGFLQILLLPLKWATTLIFSPMTWKKAVACKNWAQTLLLLSLSEAVEIPASAKLAQELG